MRLIADARLRVHQSAWTRGRVAHGWRRIVEDAQV